MPLSRPVLLALVGAIVAVAGFFATQGAREQASVSDPVPAVPADKPAKPAAKAAKAAADPAKPAADPAAAKPSPKPATPVKSKPARAATPAGLPAHVARALRAKDVTVIFFRQAGGVDDAATAKAVAAQRGRKGVAVFSADIKDLNRYRAVVADLGLSQAPAVVILGKGGTARVLEGYIDPQTLAQEVADSR
jgi:hypothetical protein